MEKDTRVDRERNWSDLADHLKDKVNKRTSEVAFLQTKAGFLIAASVVLLQIITSLPKFENLLGIAAYILAIILAFVSIVISMISMHIGSSPTPLNPDKIILELTERPNMDGRNFQTGWLKAMLKLIKILIVSTILNIANKLSPQLCWLFRLGL